MSHLGKCFQEHKGLRGVTFYDNDSSSFLPWTDVFQFLKVLSEDDTSPFSEKLLETLANYDPESQFLAVKQESGRISVELYSFAGLL